MSARRCAAWQKAGEASEAGEHGQAQTSVGKREPASRLHRPPPRTHGHKTHAPPLEHDVRVALVFFLAAVVGIARDQLVPYPEGLGVDEALASD